MNKLSNHNFSVICLNQWFLQKFDEAVKADWLKCQDVFVVKKLRNVFRYSSPAVKRAKQIHIGADKSVIMVIEVTQKENQKADISLTVYPEHNQIYLPDGLKMAILSESGEKLTEIQVITRTCRLMHPVKNLNSGDGFGFSLESGESKITEYFVL